jgi:hypothetical protein
VKTPVAGSVADETPAAVAGEGDVGPEGGQRGGGGMAGKRRWNYYATRVMSKSERRELRGAEEVDGLASEIALLRARLKRAMKGEPGNTRAMKRAIKEMKVVREGLETLMRAVAVQQRLAPKGREELAERFVATLNGLGAQLLPPDR